MKLFGKYQTVQSLRRLLLADRVIRLVLPTLWSPSSTILVLFGGEDEKSAVTGVAGDESMVLADKVGVQCM